MTTDTGDADTGLAPEEAFGLLGNDTRIAILRTLWEEFESGLGDNALAYSELFDAVEYRDSGNFSYHLEKLTGPFVRETPKGYELKQTGVNVVRAVVTGTVTEDQEFGPTRIDVACPKCGSPIEVTYRDEVLSANCTDCAGALRWNGDAGTLYLGLVPPALVDQRSVEDGFRAAVTYTHYQLAALQNGVCPHCSGVPDRHLDVCNDHEPSTASLCPSCDRHHRAEARMVCRTCKWRVFPPAIAVLLADPDVVAFYHDHGVAHRCPSWDAYARSFDTRPDLVSEDSLRLRYTFEADGDELHVSVDRTVNVVDVSR